MPLKKKNSCPNYKIKKINSRNPKFQVPNFYLILPSLNLNASNSPKKKLNTSITTICCCYCVVPHIRSDLQLLACYYCCCSSDPWFTSTVVHTHTWVESAKVWWIWKISLLSQVHICVFFFFYALLLCLYPLRFLGIVWVVTVVCVVFDCLWFCFLVLVFYFYYFIYKGITLSELASIEKLCLS